MQSSANVGTEVAFDITSPSNDRIKWLVRLGERRHRDREGLFVVEGGRLYRRALNAGLIPVITFVSGPDRHDLAGETLSVVPGVLDKASYRKRSEGLIGVFPQFETTLNRIELSPTPLLLIAENIEKPGNLGAMMRTAAAAGAEALITVGSTVDPFNPNSLRTSTGAVFTLPLAVSSWDEAGPWLEKGGIEVIGASPDAGIPLWTTDLRGPVAVVIGAEDTGLSERAASVARQLVAIPRPRPAGSTR